MTTTIALAGNPNCGKTTLFNELTGSKQYVGNWSGVTVEKKTGIYRNDDSVEVADLPGVYSLSPYTPEEVVTRDFILKDNPDVVINIVDATNLERNLYLTTQILDLGVSTVVALNMMDRVEKNGDSIDVEQLSQQLGCPVVEVSALRNRGIGELMEKALKAAERGSAGGNEAQSKGRFGDCEILLTQDADESAVEEAIGSRYDTIVDICGKCVTKAPNKVTTTQKIDRILTNRVLGIPIFIAIMFSTYFLAISVGGGLLTDWVKDGIAGAGWWYGGEGTGVWVPGLATIVEEGLTQAGAAPWAISLVVDGILSGVGAVISFVPQLIILFLLLGFLEGCGYMARVAFIMDRIFRRFGLSGKSFIPMLIASGCGVPAVMATRTIKSEKDRRMTIMTTTMIPCGAKLPIIALVFGALAGADASSTWWVAPLFYFLGLAAIIVSCIMLKKFRAFSGKVDAFVMELPQYHLPTAKSVLISTWERVRSYVVKAGTVIFLSTIVIWFLMNFGFYGGQFGLLDPEREGYLRYSLMAGIGSGVSWLFAPLGFGNWESVVTTINGLVAKENVVATVGIISSLSDAGEGDPTIWQGFAAMLGGSSAAIMAFCAFNLLCAPCFAAIGAIRRQMSSAKWTLATIGYMCTFAWALALMIYQLGGLAIGEVAFSGWTLVAIVVACTMLFLMFRPTPKTREHREGVIAAEGSVA